MTLKKPVGLRVAYYFDPKTGLWARSTRDREHHTAYPPEWDWMTFESLLPRHREKLSLLLLVEPGPTSAGKFTSIPGVGKVRLSRIHKSHKLVFYKLLNDAWRKEL